MPRLRLARLLGAIAMVAVPTGVLLATTASHRGPRPWRSSAKGFIESLARKLGLDEFRLRRAVNETVTELRPEFKDQRRKPKQQSSIIRTFIDETAQYISLDLRTLVGRLRKGESAAAIAQSEDKSRQGLIDALGTRMSENFDRLVTAGRLSQEQADIEMERVMPIIIRWADFEVTRPVTPLPGPRGPAGNLDLSTYGGVLL